MKKLVVVFLALVMAMSLTTVAWADESNETVVSSGTWGGIDWTLTDSGTLTIAPTVNEITKIKPYSETNPKELYQVGEVPVAVNDAMSAITGWPFNRTAVKKLVIEEGVTSIGSFALQGLTNLTGEVVIPSTVTYIGQEAFQNSPMTKLTFAKGGTEELCISPGAFKSLKITELTLPEDRPVHLHSWAFQGNKALENVTFPANVTGFQGQTHLEYCGMDAYYSGDSQVLAGCPNLKTLIFGSEEVQTMFENAPNNKGNMETLGNNLTIATVPTTYTITFDSDGGTIADGKNVTSYTYGTSVTLPVADDMTKTGYTFAGWYADKTFTGDAVTEIANTETGSKTYYAKWTADTYTVTFDSDGGSDVTTQTVVYGGNVIEPDAPTKSGYTFKGWTENGVAYDFGTVVKRDITLVAIWESIPIYYPPCCRDSR